MHRYANDRALLPQKARRQGALRRVQRACRICKTAQRQVSIHGKQDVLFKLQGALLQARDAAEDKRGNAVFRSENDISSPYFGNQARYRKLKRETEAGK